MWFTRFQRHAVLCVLLFCISAAAADGPEQTESPQSPAAPQPDPKHVPAYILGPEDEFQIWARDAEEIGGRSYRIDARGEVNLPLVGRIQAGGITVEEFEFHLRERLRKYIREPQVAVTMMSFRSAPVFVFGAVQKPGILQLLGPKTLVEVISMAGGLAPESGEGVVVTRRLEYGRIPLPAAMQDDQDQFSVAEVRMKNIVAGRNLEENIVIRPYDVITVPRTDVIYVSGEVRNPGGFPPAAGKMTVLQAVSLAGGLVPTARPQEAKVLRPISGGPKRYDIALNLKPILTGEAQDFPLQPGDILFVPRANVTARAIMGRTIEAFISAGANIGIWSVLWRDRR